MAEENKDLEKLAERGSVKKIREVFKASEEGRKPRVSSTFEQALVGFLPTIVGAAFGGAEGAAIGAQVGGRTLETLAQQEIAGQQIAVEEEKQRKAALVQAALQQERLEETDRAKKEERLFREKEIGAKLFQTRQLQEQKLQKELPEKLRKEFDKDPITLETKKVLSGYGRLEAAGKDPSAAGDLALIFNYMKILDPGSTVREGEFANAQNSGGVPDRVRAMYNNVMKGERLAPRVRKDFLDRAGKLVEGQLQTQSLVDERYTRLSQEAGVRPELVISPELKKRLPEQPVKKILSDEQKKRLQELRKKAGR
jgi:hypothetical protein